MILCLNINLVEWKNKLYEMKNKITLMSLVVVMLCVMSCRQDPTVDTRQPWPDGEQTIAYTVDETMAELTLRSDADWDNFMGRLLDYAEAGCAVSLYNAGRQVKPGYGTGRKKGACCPKKEVTFSSTDRREMMDWCRRMEADGKTVTIVYDKRTGTWSGTAYVRAPHEALPSVTDVYYYYELGGERVLCTVDTTTVYVAMNVLADSVLIKQLMAMGDALQVYGKFIVIENLKVGYTTLQNMLDNSGQLELLSPAILHHVYPDSMLFVAVPPGNIAAFRELLSGRGLTVVDSVPSEGFYQLNTGSRFGLNTVRAAADLYETGLFNDVTPYLFEIYHNKGDAGKECKRISGFCGGRDTVAPAVPHKN